MKSKTALGLLILASLLLYASCASNAFLEYDQEKQNRLNNQIHDLLIAQMEGSSGYEFKTEGHVILTAEDRDDGIYVYIIAHNDYYGFEDDAFCSSGSAFPANVFPAVAVLPNSEDGSGGTMMCCSLNVYGEPDEVWLKEHFPPAFVGRAKRTGDVYGELIQQMDAHAKAYLKSIGSSAEITERNIDKPWVYEYVTSGELSKQTFNLLNEELGLFNTYPDWIGSRETVEASDRYIYCTGVEYQSGGNLALVFTRRLSDGTIVEAYEAFEKHGTAGIVKLVYSQKLSDGSMVVLCELSFAEDDVE